jgi:heme A synthase
MVADIKPLLLPVLVRLNQLVAQVLVGGVFTHLDVGTSDYSWVVGTRLWLQPEEFANKIQWGLIPTKVSQK